MNKPNVNTDDLTKIDAPLESSEEPLEVETPTEIQGGSVRKLLDLICKLAS